MFDAVGTVKGRRAADGNTVAYISCSFLVVVLFMAVREDHYTFHHNKK